MRKSLKVGGGVISLGDDFWLRVDDSEGGSVSVWLSRDDLVGVAHLFSTFHELVKIDDAK